MEHFRCKRGLLVLQILTAVLLMMMEGAYGYRGYGGLGYRGGYGGLGYRGGYGGLGYGGLSYRGLGGYRGGYGGGYGRLGYPGRIATDIVSGSGAPSGSGSGSESGSTSVPEGCINAGFRSCCEPATQNCLVDAGVGFSCYCDRVCFQFGDCCDDILDVPCFPFIDVRFIPQNYTVNEADDNVTVNVRATGFPLQDFDIGNVSVFLFTEDVTAVAGQDYMAVMLPLSFSANGEYEVTILITDNIPVEVPEVFEVQLSSDSDLVVFDNFTRTATVEIIDDDRLTLRLEDPMDTAESAGFAEVCVTIVSGVLQSDLEVVVALDVSPLDPQDLGDFGPGLNIRLNSTVNDSQCAPIPIRMDSIIEGNETFLIRALVIDSPVAPFPLVDFENDTVDIIIIDSTVGVLALQPSDVAIVVEDRGFVEVCAVINSVTLERDVIATIRTFPTEPVTAIDPDDYAGGVFNITFESPNTTVCFSINITRDDIFEDDEAFFVELFSDDPATGSSVAIVPVIIVDQSAIPFDFTETLYFVQEDEIRDIVCVEVQGNLNRTVDLTIFTTDVTAESDSTENDYVSVSEQIVFNATTNEVCVDIVINEDLIVEEPESFTVGLSTDDEDAVFVRQQIEDFIVDTTQVEIQFEFMEYFVEESSGSVTVCVLQTSVPPVSFARPVELIFNTIDGSATGPQDFEPIVDRLIEFPDTRCITIGINEDSEDEGDESFSLRVTTDDPAVVFGANSEAIINIIMLQRAAIGIEFATYRVAEEAGMVEVCVVADGFLTENVTIFLLSQDGTAISDTGVDDDYEPVSELLTLRVGNFSRVCVSITIEDDDADELDEDFTLRLGIQNSWPIFRNTSSVTIVDNDVVQVGLDPIDYTVIENTDSAAVVCARLDRPLQRNGVRVQFSTRDGSALSGSDYTMLTEIVTFNSGDQEVCVPITILTDDIAESAEETFFVDLTSITSENIFSTPATVTIQDDDEAPVTLVFEQPTYSVTETDGSQTITVCVEALNGVLRNGVEAIVIAFQFTGEAMAGLDYVTVRETLVFNSGDTSMCFDVTILGDMEPEDTERFILQLTSDDATIGSPGSAIVTIDDDDGPQELRFGFVDPQLLEFGEGSGTVEVCVEVTSGIVSEDTEVVVQSGQSGDTATAGMDYIAVTETLLFTPGGSTEMCVSVTILDDSVDENNEFFTCIITVGGQQQDLVPITIIDNDSPPEPEFGFVDPQLLVFGEGSGTVEVCVELTSGIVSEDTQVVVQSGQPGDTATAGMDYIAVTETLIFTPGGSTEMCVSVTILDDSVDENSEFFTCIITVGGLQQDLVQITIIDNENPGPRIGLEQPFYTTTEESGAVQLCVSITQMISGTVTATVTTFSQTAIADSDFISLSTTLTFSDDDLRKCVEVRLIDDDVDENQESFLVVVASSDLLVFRAQAIVTISADADGQLIVTLQEPIMAVDEGKIQLPVCVDFLGSTLSNPIIVTLTTITGTAVENDDYVGESSDITYFPRIEEVIICENVTINDDAMEEEIEIFGVTITTLNPVVTFRESSGIVIIVDNDNTELSAGFVQTDVRVQETDGFTSARLRAFVNGRITQPVTLQISIQPGGTATVGEDYNTAAGILTFNTNADNPQREFYTILGDAEIEPDETFPLRLSAQTGGVRLIGDRTDALVTIVNDDFIPAESGIIVLIDDTPEVIEEAGGTISVRVRFSRSADVANVECALLELRQAQNCNSGEITFSGLPRDRRPPLFLEITAFDGSGQQLAFVSRPVRLGFNGDCAVNYLNGVEQSQVFQGVVYIQFSFIGDVDFTDCQLDDGQFIPCTSPVVYSGLSPGQHRVKVRPNGSNCVRRIRRTVEFDVV